MKHSFRCKYRSSTLFCRICKLQALRASRLIILHIYISLYPARHFSFLDALLEKPLLLCILISAHVDHTSLSLYLFFFNGFHTRHAYRRMFIIIDGLCSYLFSLYLSSLLIMYERNKNKCFLCYISLYIYSLCLLFSFAFSLSLSIYIYICFFFVFFFIFFFF